MHHRFTIVGLGEALFDLMPSGDRLGGAPLNVAVGAHQLAQPFGGRGVVASRVGQDDLGARLIRELRNRGLDPRYVQSDPDRDTGVVYVEFGPDGDPSYEIPEDVAWDVIQYDFDLEDLARQCQGVCFGTLAQRDGQSRNTIYRFLSDARRAVRLLDLNLRPPGPEPTVIRRSLEFATAVKLSESELGVVAEVVGLSASDPGERARALISRYDLAMVAVTRGADGATLVTPDGVFEAEPRSHPPAENADPVGAGDAFTSALIVGMVRRVDWERIANCAAETAGYVASQPGATPPLPEAITQLYKASDAR